MNKPETTPPTYFHHLRDGTGFEVILVNARDAKHVPGRKTDISDAQWLQRLHGYGLLRASFRLKGEVAVMRAYLRSASDCWTMPRRISSTCRRG